MPFGAPADRTGRWSSILNIHLLPRMLLVFAYENGRQWQHTLRLGPSIHQVGSPNRWTSDAMAACVVAEILNPPSWMPKSLKISLGRSLGGSREGSGEFWGVLGGVWEVLGEFWGGLGRRLGGLGRGLGWSWEGSGVVLRPCWTQDPSKSRKSLRI